MKKTKPTNNNLTSRVIPGLKSQYRIVSLPYWAWFWLDEFMIQNRLSYQGILETFGCDGDINNTLRGVAELHQEHCMRGMHNLANDNVFHAHKNPNRLIRKKSLSVTKKYNMPKIYKLFGFVPCTTTLNSVWTRKNYDDHNKIN